MSVDLLAIKFNHDPTSATGDALNLRKNGSEWLIVPEWRQGNMHPEDSVAAYALQETRGRTITIQAQFARTAANLETIEVRAVQPPVPDLPGWWLDWLTNLLWVAPTSYYFYYNYLTYLWESLWASQSSVLGTVQARQVTFGAHGETGFETFTLQNPRLQEMGVGKHHITWQWQFRCERHTPWTTFATTTHQIYTVLDLPTLPWTQSPYNITNTQMPWIEVLDYACHWAASAFSLDSAAARITRSVYTLGPQVVEYGCPVNAITVYAFPEFNCTAFLQRLRGGFGRGPYINCTDCATIVSTFANILGCSLWQSQMRTFDRPFPVNPILAIGSNIWAIPCGIGLFNYHEVAWKDRCRDEDQVFDACLEVDSTPPFPPYQGILPIDMRFGRPGDGQYRDLLAAPWGRNFCEPQPGLRQRRQVF